MKKKVIICFTLLIIAILLVITYAIDIYMMKNNKPVVFSTWGYDYAPPENGYQIMEIQDNTKTDNYTCDTALEKIYEDSVNSYYFSCIKSGEIIVKYANGYEENIKSALQLGHISINDLNTYSIKYITEKKDKENTHSFIATILEETTRYMIVEPDENENERKSSDKIVVNYTEEHIGYLYGIGTKVQIYYDGYIMETYPAQINSTEIYVIN